MAKAFASQADLTVKKETFEKLADGVYCLTAEGDPNTGIIVGDDGVMIIDARATPVMAQTVIEFVRGVTDKPIKYVFLTHYHAVRVMGASAYNADYVIASRPTLEMIEERGAQDFKSEVQRFPRLFDAVESVPGLTWPNLVFDREMTLWMGKREVRMMHPGRGHTRGDAVVWLPKEKVLFSGDLVEADATPYCGDAQLKDWPETLEKLKELKPSKLVPGRGPALKTPKACRQAIEETQGFVTALYKAARKGVKKGRDLREIYREVHDKMKKPYGHWAIFDHCLPFNVTRAVDEASGLDHPRIWTAKRDLDMWKALEG